MTALDTNVLVRILVRDDAVQLATARKLIRKCLDDGEVLFVPVTVALELEWVLRSAFGFDKHTVVQALSDLLSAADLIFESEAALEMALAQYGSVAADFSDCLHTALAVAAGAAPRRPLRGVSLLRNEPGRRGHQWSDRHLRPAPCEPHHRAGERRRRRCAGQRFVWWERHICDLDQRRRQLRNVRLRCHEPCRR